MFCPKCGKEITDGAAFCRGCGAKTRGASANASTPNAAANVPTVPTASASSQLPKTVAAAFSAVATAASSLPKAALAAIIAVVVVAGGAGIVAVAIPHGDIPNGTYRAEYGSTAIGQGGSVEIWGDNMSIKNIAGSSYYTDMSPYKVSGGKLYYSPSGDDFFWISRFYTSTSDGRIVFDYRKSGDNIVLDDVVYYKK